MKDKAIRSIPDCVQELEGVCQMFNDIEKKYQIEVPGVFTQEIGHFESDPGPAVTFPE